MQSVMICGKIFGHCLVVDRVAVYGPSLSSPHTQCRLHKFFQACQAWEAIPHTAGRSLRIIISKFFSPTVTRYSPLPMQFESLWLGHDAATPQFYRRMVGWVSDKLRLGTDDELAAGYMGVSPPLPIINYHLDVVVLVKTRELASPTFLASSLHSQSSNSHRTFKLSALSTVIAAES